MAYPFCHLQPVGCGDPVCPRIVFHHSLFIGLPIWSCRFGVYQILFTGYWYWGNFLSPQVMFTVSDTLLNASGKYALMAFYGVQISVDSPEVASGQRLSSNIIVLLGCAGIALAGHDRLHRAE